MTQADGSRLQAEFFDHNDTMQGTFLETCKRLIHKPKVLRICLDTCSCTDKSYTAVLKKGDQYLTEFKDFVDPPSRFGTRADNYLMFTPRNGPKGRFDVSGLPHVVPAEELEERLQLWLERHNESRSASTAMVSSFNPLAVPVDAEAEKAAHDDYLKMIVGEAEEKPFSMFLDLTKTSAAPLPVFTTTDVELTSQHAILASLKTPKVQEVTIKLEEPTGDEFTTPVRTPLPYPFPSQYRASSASSSGASSSSAASSSSSFTNDDDEWKEPEGSQMPDDDFTAYDKMVLPTPPPPPQTVGKKRKH